MLWNCNYLGQWYFYIFMIHALYTYIYNSCMIRWPNRSTLSRLRRGRQRKWAPNRPKMWDNFTRLTARLAKSRALLFWDIFEQNFRIKYRTLQTSSFTVQGRLFWGYFYRRAPSLQCLKSCATDMIFKSRYHLTKQPEHYYITKYVHELIGPLTLLTTLIS